MVTGRCQCGEKVEMVPTDLGRWGFVKHSCGRRPLTPKGEGQVSSGDEGSPSGRPPQKWSNAKRTTCNSKHTHASKMEARVCDRLMLECQVEGKLVIQQIRLPLLRLAQHGEKPTYMSIDFAVLAPGGELLRLIDAKAQSRVSKDWPARKRALELSWGIKVEEVDR